MGTPQRTRGYAMTAVPSVEYELTPEDWEAVNAAHIFESPVYVEAARKTRVVGGLLFATLSAYCFLAGAATGGVLFAVAGPPFVYFVGPLMRKSQLASLRKMRRQGISNGLFGRHRIEVREDGLYHATDAYETLIRWHAIDDVKQKDDHFFVYTGPNAFVPIPVTAFPDAERMRAFSHAFHERMANAGRVGDASSRSLAGSEEGAA